MCASSFVPLSGHLKGYQGKRPIMKFMSQQTKAPRSLVFINSSIFFLWFCMILLMLFGHIYDVCSVSKNIDEIIILTPTILILLATILGHIVIKILGFKRGSIHLVLLALLVLATFFFSAVRQGEYRRLSISFEGLLQEKYLSSNHRSRAFKVGGKEFEPIPMQAWDAFEVGDYVRKEYCSDQIQSIGSH